MNGPSAALLALHYQNEVLHPDGRIRLGVAEGKDRSGLTRAAFRLFANARMTAVPIVHVRIAFPRSFAGVALNAPIFRQVQAVSAMEEGSWGAAFHDDFCPRPGEAVVTHQRVNAFFDSPLEMVLRGLRATRLIIAGIATNSTVEHSARHAADMGYEVVVAADACSAATPEIHDAALFNIALIGDVTTVAQLCAAGLR